MYMYLHECPEHFRVLSDEVLHVHLVRLVSGESCPQHKKLLRCQLLCMYTRNNCLITTTNVKYVKWTLKRPHEWHSGVLTQFTLVEEVLVFVSATKVENTRAFALTQHCKYMYLIIQINVAISAALSLNCLLQIAQFKCNFWNYISPTHIFPEWRP